MKDSNMTREISKTYVTTRNYSPGAGNAELVDVIVLPGYLKSGVEGSQAKNEIDRIERELAKLNGLGRLFGSVLSHVALHDSRG